MESSLVCSFSSFLPDKSKCTTSPYFPNENSLVYVKNCRRNIKNHLKSCNIGDIASEGHLICYRAGVFSLFGDYTICPFHRYSLGIRWKKKSSCSHPSHSTTAKAEVGRSITLSMSRHLHTVYGIIVPIGSGLCSRCRKNVTQEMKWCECCKDASSAQICKITSDDTPEATSQQSRNLQTRTENYAEQCHSETENSAEQCHSETLSQVFALILDSLKFVYLPSWHPIGISLSVRPSICLSGITYLGHIFSSLGPIWQILHRQSAFW